MKVFSDHVHYIFDAGTSAGHLTTDVGDALRLFAPGDHRVEHLIEDRSLSTIALAEGITAQADVAWTRPGRSTAVQRGLLSYATAYLSLQIGEVADTAAHQLASMATDYGSRSPRKKLVRYACSDAGQWKVARQVVDSSVLVDRVPRLFRLFCENDVKQTVIEDIREYEQASSDYWRIANDISLDAFRRRYEGVLSKKVISSYDRKKLKRAMRLAQSVVGRPLLEDFLRGRSVVISGRRFQIVVTCCGVFKDGHGGVDVKLNDATGARLARLCVYFDKTPAVDQLVALYLYMINGMEIDLLLRANVIERYEAAESNEDFQRIQHERANRIKAMEKLLFPPGGHLDFRDFSVELCRKIATSMTEKVFVAICSNNQRLARALFELSKSFRVDWSESLDQIRRLPIA